MAIQRQLQMKIRCILVISCAAVLLTVGILAYENNRSNPKSAFERLVMKPLPKSVRFIEQGHLLTMDSTFWIFRFQISKADLLTMLNVQHFAPLDENKGFKRWDQGSNNYVQIPKDEFLKEWEQRIRFTTRMDVKFARSSQIWFLREGSGEKRVFFDTNNMEAVFIAEAH